MSRATKPYEQVKAMLNEASPAWEKLTGHIRTNYVMDEVWDEGKPTHKHHSNLYFRRGGKTLVNLCIREGYFIVSIVLGKDERAKFDEQRESFGMAICKEYDETEIYHDGKWLGFEVRDDALIDDIIRLLYVKRKPNRKKPPQSVENSEGVSEHSSESSKDSENLKNFGRLDIGLSHDDITAALFGN